MLDKMEDIENRVSELEKKQSEKPPPPPIQTFSEALRSQTDNRINKLEFSASEQERNNRVLQATITPPKIDISDENLNEHIRDFMKNELRMDQRSIDQNMIVKKFSKLNTVHVTFSHRRFKLFLYSAKKRAKTENLPVFSGLYVNDYLTQNNFSLLMELKREKKRRITQVVVRFRSSILV